MGWRYPKTLSLEEIVEKNQLYPITMLRGVESHVLERLGDLGIVTLRQLLEMSSEELRELPIDSETLRELVAKAESVLEKGR